jgi:hypothetical protein
MQADLGPYDSADQIVLEIADRNARTGANKSFMKIHLGFRKRNQYFFADKYHPF